MGNIVESGTVASAFPQNPSPATLEEIPANPNSLVAQQIDAVIENEALLAEIGTADDPTTTELPLDAMMTTGGGRRRRKDIRNDGRIMRI